MYMLVLRQTIVKYLYTVYVYCGYKCFNVSYDQGLLYPIASTYANYARIVSYISELYRSRYLKSKVVYRPKYFSEE